MSRAIYVPQRRAGLFAEWEDLGRSFHMGPVQIEKVTQVNKFFGRWLHVFVCICEEI